MRPKSAKLIAALLATSALCAAGVQLGTEQAARQRVRALVAAHPGLTVDRVETSLVSGDVTLIGVKAGAGTTTISIGALRLPLSRTGLGLIDSAVASPFDDEPEAPAAKPDVTPPPPPAAPPAPPPAAAAPPPASAPDTASAENVVITDGTATFTIKRIELTGTKLSNADLAAILDQKSPASLGDRLAKLSAATISIPEVMGDDVTKEHEQHWSERDILLTNVVAGRVASGTAAGMTLAMKDPKSVVNAKFGAIDMKGADLTKLVRLFGTKRTDESEPVVPLLDSITINGGEFTNVTQNSTITFGLIKETGFKGRPLKGDAADASSSDKEKSKAAVDDVLHSFALESFETSNFTFHDEGKNDQFRLAKIAMRDFGGGKIGGLSANDFLFQGDGTKVAIGSMEIGAFDVPGQTAAASAGDAKKAAIPLVGKTDIKDVTVDASVPGSDPGAAPTHVKFDLKHIGFTGEGKPGDPPKSAAMAIDNFTMDVPPNSAGQPLIEMGYPHLDISGGTKMAYDSAAQTLAISDFALSGVGMGTVSLGFDLSNVAPAIFGSDQDAQKVAALAVLIKGADLKVENAGLVQKLLAWQGKASGQTADQVRAGLVDAATKQVPDSLGGGANAKAIGAAVGKFLTDPKSLHISAKSKTGLSAADMALLATPDVLLNALEVKATANE